MSEQPENYDKAFELAATSLNRLDDAIQVGALTLRQRGVVMHFIYQEAATRQNRAEAFEQLSAITGDEFFGTAATHVRVTSNRQQSLLRSSDSIAISTRRL